MKICLNCDLEFINKKQKQKFCSPECVNEYRKSLRPKTNCKNCQKLIPVKKTSKNTWTKFCNRSCAASYNNKKYPKRQLEGICSECNVQCASSKKYCSSCLEIMRKESYHKWSEMTLGEYKGSGNANYASGYPYIRALARKKYIKNNNDHSCKICQYDKHIDVCHIKGISSFSLSATIAEINHIDNLIGLCKNHHWELDNGYLDLYSFH